jgi:hypothetical protein
VNNEIQPITQEHETFKQEIRAKLISMRNQRHSMSLPSVNNAPICASSFVDDSNQSISSGPTLASMVSLPTTTGVNNIPHVSPPAFGNDVFQTQMLQMLNDTFSELLTVLLDSKTTTKSEWPKFFGRGLKIQELATFTTSLDTTL